MYTTETNVIGRTITEADVENLEDLWAVQQGLLAPEQARRIHVIDALIHTGNTLLSMPLRLIQQLGLAKVTTKQVTTSGGEVRDADLYDPVCLTIHGRTCTVDVLEIPDHMPMLVGKIPLVLLDFVVDPRGGKLIGNPAHGGEHIFELY